MSSLVERLRVRSEKRPLYLLDESDEDDFVASKGPKKQQQQDEENRERLVRDDAKEAACQLCGESGDLTPCATCTYSFHKKCLYPPSRICKTDSWSCPECISPLAEIEKFLDCELRPVAAEEENDSTNSNSRKINVKHYLVKWKGLSYLHCTWLPEKEFLKASRIHPRLKNRLNNFDRLMESTNKSEDEWVAIRPEWTTVDRVIASRKTGDERECLVKWKELPYDECTWEVESDISAFKAEIDRYSKIQSRGRKKSSTKGNNIRCSSKEPLKSKQNEEPSKLKQNEEPSKLKQNEEPGSYKQNDGLSKPRQNEEASKPKQNEFQHYDQTPEFLNGGKLHPYQLEGLNFLRYSWAKNTHVILADEMGLGKTIQSIAFLASLFEENLSPHLVIAPLSTLRNWEREFATWAPQMNVVMYFGSSQSRDVIRKYEFYFPKEKEKKHMMKKPVTVDDKKKQARIKFNVLLASYEMINMDSGVLKQIQWQSMIVDEGHRLKNKDSKLFHQLKLFSTNHRVLLTGTPLQNNLDELFMLMHFLDAGKFASIEDFQKEFKDINQEEQVDRLHKMLAPHLLRRVKKDVMKDLPPKTELILRVELSSIQKEYYKAILTRNYSILVRRGGPQVSLINVVMELRKLCCHAYMLEGVEAATEASDANDGVRLFLEASGKMQLLDKMMVKLKEQGHRVLIYSQFQHMLDILEDYLTYKKWTYERIDGKVSGAERQIRIDRFNSKNSNRFCFLLSTRAGGLGINLATADTVIIYDSDWNPHADLQAMARAHRLGQTNKVMIYRLITRGTIEERMMQMTKKKMILEHLVVGRLKTQNVNQEELDDIIRYGSKELFADESDEAKARQIHYDDAAIDRLLNRENIIGEEPSVDEEDDDFLKAFKVANFEYIDEVEAAAAAAAEEESKQAANEKASNSNIDRANYWDDLLRDRYEVQQIEELTTMGKGKRSRRQMTATEEDLQEASSEDEDYCYEDDLSDIENNATGNASGKRGPISKKRRENFEYPLMEGEGRSLRVLGFNQNQRSMFLQLLMRFGFQDYTWKEFVNRLKGKSCQEIHNYGALFMSHLCEGVNDSPTFSDGVPKEGLRVDDIMVRCGHIQLIEEKVDFMSKNPGANLFGEDILMQFPGLAGRFWKAEHDLKLLKAILKHGYARWQYIVEDEETGIGEVARKELNLPSGPFPASGQTNESLSSGQLPNSSTLNPSETSGVTNGTQVYQDSAATLQSRELQRRIVDVIRKRYMLIEKALDCEFSMTNSKPCEKATQDRTVNLELPEANNPSILHTGQLMKQLPKLEKISLDESVNDNEDSKRERLDMVHLYNAMCRVVDESVPYSVEAFLRDQSAMSKMRGNLQQLDIIQNEINKLLSDQGQVAAGESSKANTAVDGSFL